MCVMARDRKTKKILIHLVLELQKDNMGCFVTRRSGKDGIMFKIMHYMEKLFQHLTQRYNASLSITTLVFLIHTEESQPRTNSYLVSTIILRFVY